MARIIGVKRVAARLPAREGARRRAARPATPGRAWGIALVVAVSLVGAFLVSQLVLRRFPFGSAGEASDVKVALVHCLLIAYVIGAYRFITAGARDAVRSLERHLLMPRPAFEAELDGVGRYPIRVLAPVAVAGVLVAVFGPYLTGPSGAPYWDPRLWTHEVSWHRVLGLGIGIGMALMSYAVIVESTRLSRLAGSLKPVSLWDTERPLAPVTRQGLRNALVGVGLVSVFGLFLPEQGITNAFLLILISALALAVAGVLLPLRGVRNAIGETKRRELEWASHMIENERAGFEAGTEVGGRLADMVAYREAVERVREWPFDQSTAFRVLLYLLVPAASWLISNVAAGVLEQLIFTGR